MSPAARSVQFFGGYLLGLGVLLVLTPALVLMPAGLPAPQEVWIRVAGMLVVLLGVYYLVAARSECRPIIQATVWVRASVPLCFAGFVATGLAPAALLLFALPDVAGAIWTARALRPAVADMDGRASNRTLNPK